MTGTNIHALPEFLQKINMEKFKYPLSQNISLFIIIMYFIKLCQNAESTIFKSMWGWDE